MKEYNVESNKMENIISDKVQLENNSESFFVHNEDESISHKIKNEKKFHSKQGHGFAAETANDLIDKMSGKEINLGFGNKNEKHGADRYVDGALIQTKYYSNYKDPIDKYFSKEQVTYVDESSGELKPMKFEIPPEQYKEAVDYLQKKIDEGLFINGKRITVKAEDILVKGKIPYKVAKCISKGNNPIAWTYDALSGAILYRDEKGKIIRESNLGIGSHIPTFWEGIGMAAGVTFIQNMIDGRGLKDSLKTAFCVGLKNGRIQIKSYIFAGSLAKSGAVKKYDLAKEKFKNAIVKYGPKVIRDSVVKKLFKQFEGPLGSVISSCALLTTLSRKDVCKLFIHRISFSQAIKNISKNVVSEIGNVGGKIVGSIVGGGISGGAMSYAGGQVGSIVGYGAGKIINVILDKLMIDDANKMLQIIEEEYFRITSDYLLSEKEHELAISKCVQRIDNIFLEKMFASTDRQEYANRMIKPIIDNILFKRRIEMNISNSQIANAFENMVDEAVEDIIQEEQDCGFFTELRISYRNEFGENCCPHCGAVLSGYEYVKCFYCLNIVEIEN